MSRPRVVVAGLGDSGLLTAIRLARHADVVGISSKPGLVSGQELGSRLSRPDVWSVDYRIAFDRFRRLDSVRTLHGMLIGVDLVGHTVTVQLSDGKLVDEPFDVLVVSTGVTNGFWRTSDLQTTADIDADLRVAHERLASASSVVIVGGGAAAVSSAANIAGASPATRVDLYFPGARALPLHHPRVWRTVERRLRVLGVGVHPNHRAVVPAGFTFDRITDETIEWVGGQPAVTADAVLWAIGRVRPNTDWLPAELLDDGGFVRVAPDLHLPGNPRVFAIGDVAATDPLRSSARNRADRLLAHNIRAELAGRPLRDYRPPRRRWGSVLGTQPDGLQVFAPNGRAFRIPPWAVQRILRPLIVRRGIYLGVRRFPREPHATT
ncbi:FAD-dependent oxidoreductase [Antrihabitans sp. YC3-6]|uniref:FAD-dependent oxidoreductase n=1 Tax=Antrihabitans stalagmiti TaxID=2799499 RepID=A0A934NMQ7_9NOCA|nr:FAD-dependent oxidoreductase [Antrihabitans stalagmiti]MBJ8338044.1 FAD-dependent oxidoreductase [Antrihabitans stalagmiti]